MSEDKGSFFKSDKNLFLRLKKYKDRQAFITAYDLYINDIYRFVFFKVGNKEEAEDITSSVFVKCWTYVRDGKLNDSNEYKSLKAFLYKIARNAVIDYYRQNKPEVELEEAEEVPNKKEQDQIGATNIDFELVKEKLTELKTEYRGVIVMHYINQLSISEISDILGKSKGNVRVILHRALSALREIIEK
ncbi:MAG: RNA polymerase sigma factor [bacterium]